MQNAECRIETASARHGHSAFCILHSAFKLTMADRNEQTPAHEVRPTTQELRIPARFIPSPTVEPGHTFASVTDHISSIVLRKRMPPGWWLLFGVGTLGMGLLTVAIVAIVGVCVGLWGINHPVGWGFDIINFVWWIGIGHAGTLISAILLLLRQGWRTSINRFAEAMTLFAVAAAGLYPALHTGRPWYDYWLFPYPNTMVLWPQFRSPLMWDVFAVSTYATVSFLFWFVGLIPDWHATFFPPYFVAGAVYAGFAMVLTLSIPARKMFKLEDFITMRHLENMGKVMLATGLIVFYAYVIEAFFAFYSGNTFEKFMWINRSSGPYRHMYYALIVCNGLAPQLMWFRRIRTSALGLFITEIGRASCRE